MNRAIRQYGNEIYKYKVHATATQYYFIILSVLRDYIEIALK